MSTTSSTQVLGASSSIAAGATMLPETSGSNTMSIIAYALLVGGSLVLVSSIATKFVVTFIKRK